MYHPSECLKPLFFLNIWFILMFFSGSISAIELKTGDTAKRKQTKANECVLICVWTCKIDEDLFCFLSFKLLSFSLHSQTWHTLLGSDKAGGGEGNMALQILVFDCLRHRDGSRIQKHFYKGNGLIGSYGYQWLHKPRLGLVKWSWSICAYVNGCVCIYCLSVFESVKIRQSVLP